MDKLEWFAEAEERSRKKFAEYAQLLDGVVRGDLRHLMVCGGPGLSKSYTAEEVFKRADKAESIFYSRFSGHMTPLSLYNNLYSSRGSDDVIMFDDCDAVFKTPAAMNILKAAMDTKVPRIISWSSTTGKAYAPQFTMNGRVVVITNLPLHSEQLAPLVDRALVCPMDLSDEERTAHVIRVLFEIIDEGPLLDDVAHWLLRVGPHMGQRLTVRSGIKAMELAKMSPGNWKELALRTLLAI